MCSHYTYHLGSGPHEYKALHLQALVMSTNGSPVDDHEDQRLGGGAETSREERQRQTQQPAPLPSCHGAALGTPDHAPSLNIHPEISGSCT